MGGTTRRVEKFFIKQNDAPENFALFESILVWRWKGFFAPSMLSGSFRPNAVLCVLQDVITLKVWDFSEPNPGLTLLKLENVLPFLNSRQGSAD